MITCFRRSYEKHCNYSLNKLLLQFFFWLQARKIWPIKTECFWQEIWNTIFTVFSVRFHVSWFEYQIPIYHFEFWLPVENGNFGSIFLYKFFRLECLRLPVDRFDQNHFDYYWSLKARHENRLKWFIEGRAHFVFIANWITLSVEFFVRFSFLRKSSKEQSQSNHIAKVNAIYFYCNNEIRNDFALLIHTLTYAHKTLWRKTISISSWKIWNWSNVHTQIDFDCAIEYIYGETQSSNHHLPSVTWHHGSKRIRWETFDRTRENEARSTEICRIEIQQTDNRHPSEY